MKKELDIQIGIRVRLKREELKLSREKLAECIDVSPQFLAQIELGRRGMSSFTLCKICKALGASADYIVLGKEENREVLTENVIEEVSELGVLMKLLANIEREYIPYAHDLLVTFVLAISKEKP